MAHYKPKAASPIYSEARLLLLREPWLRYKEIHAKMTQTCNSSTVEVYGASIRHEIGCELRSVGGKERMEVDYDKYLTACNKYAVRPFTAKTLVKMSTVTRQVVIKDVADQAEAAIEAPCQVVTETIHLGGDIKAKRAKLTRAFEEAELRMSEAGSELRGLEALREDLMRQVSDLDEKISRHRQAVDEASQAMDVMLELVDAPDAVIDMVL